MNSNHFRCYCLSDGCGYTMDDTRPIRIPTQDGRSAWAIAFEEDGRHLVWGQSSGNVYRSEVSSTPTSIAPSVMNTRGDVYAVIASKDGQWIVSGDSRGKVIVWRVPHYHQAATEISEHSDKIYAVDVSSDSKRIATGSRDRTVRIFDITSGAGIITPLLHDAPVAGVKFSPDGSRIATATYRFSFVGIFDAHSANKLFEISIEVSWLPITPLSWSSNGRKLFVGCPGRIISFDTPTSSKFEWSTQSTGENASVISHGRFIACVSGHVISFWDSASHERIDGVVNSELPIRCVTISDDGKYLAYGHDREILVHRLDEILPRIYVQPEVHLVSRAPLLRLSDAVFTSWTLDSPLETERILSEEITQYPDPSHYTFAARSLIRARSKKWESALEDAEMSLETEQSPIGQIAKSIALIGSDRIDDALDNFDLAFQVGFNRSDSLLLLVIKSILMFMSGKRKQAISRLRGLINTTNETTKDHYIQVLGNMYLKQGEYENAVKVLEPATIPLGEDGSNPLATISLVFNWNFDNLLITAWKRLCGYLYTTGDINELGEVLLRMVTPFTEDEKERAHSQILEEIITSSGRTSLLVWNGKASACNSCLPSSPAVYRQSQVILPGLGGDELMTRMEELRAVFPLVDALVIYGRITRPQPVRFAHFRLLLPCIVFYVRSLTRDQQSVYHAETTELGEVEITTADVLPLNEPRRLAFADLRIHDLVERNNGTDWHYRDRFDRDVESCLGVLGTGRADLGTQLVYGPMIEEASSATSTADTYTRALELIAHLGQPFSPLLLLLQSDGTYKRVASDNEIHVRGVGTNFPKDVCVEVLEIL